MQVPLFEYARLCAKKVWTPPQTVFLWASLEAPASLGWGHLHLTSILSPFGAGQADAKFADADLSTKLKLLGVDVASFGGSSDFWFKRQYLGRRDGRRLLFFL